MDNLRDELTSPPKKTITFALDPTTPIKSAQTAAKYFKNYGLRNATGIVRNSRGEVEELSITGISDTPITPEHKLVITEGMIEYFAWFGIKLRKESGSDVAA